MHYISNTVTPVNFNIFYIIVLAIIFFIHIFYVICITKMALEKGQNRLFGIFAFLFPELAFIILYHKENYTYENEAKNYYDENSYFYN